MRSDFCEAGGVPGLARVTLHVGACNANARVFCAAMGFAEEEVHLTRPIHPPSQALRTPFARGRPA